MDERTRKIATIALHLAQKGDFEEAATYITRLNGSQGLIYAIIGWIDTLIGVVYPGHEYGKPIAIKFLASETGDVGGADDVDPSKAWAGRMIAARAAYDEDSFYALLQSLPEGKILGDAIMALLGMVATTLADKDKVRRAAAEVNNSAR